MSRGCPGGGRRALLRSPLKSPTDGASTLHRLLFAPSQLGHRLTPGPAAGWPSPPSRSGRGGWFAAPGVGAGPRLGEEAELRWAAPTPATRTPPPPPGDPRPSRPALPSGPSQRIRGRGEGRGRHEPEPKAEINRCVCLWPPSFPGQNRGGRESRVPPPRRGSRGEEPAVARPGPAGEGGQCPSERSPAGRWPGGGTSALRQRAAGSGHRAPGGGHRAAGGGGAFGTSVSKAGARPLLRGSPRVPRAD